MDGIWKRLKDEKRVRGFIISYYAIGVAGMVLPFTKPVFMHLTGLTILMSFLLMMLFHKGWTMRFMVASLGIYAAGFAVEVVGVQTGWVFGHYVYHASLGPQWMGTPLLIGINWLMLVYAIHHLLIHSKLHRGLRPVAGALMMVAYDILLEPVAIHWQMWQWQTGQPPLHNYVGWFVISLVFFFLLQITRVRYRNNLATLTLLAQCIFFILLNVFLIFVR
jgi:putative membrane protein